MTTEERIAKFAQDPSVIFEALALMKVGHEKDDPTERIMSHVIASVLLRFHGIPIKKGLN